MNPEKILVIQTAFIGDLILSTGFIRELKKGFPQAQIDLVTTPLSAGLFDFNPHLGKVYSYNKKGINGIFNHIKLVRQLKKTGYEVGFSLHLSTRSSLIMKQAGIPVRIGHPRMSYLTHPIAVEKGLHMKDRYIGILKPFVDFDPDSKTELHWDELHERKISKFINQDTDFKLGIAPGSFRPTKRWPRKYFIELMKKLKNEMKIFLIGGPKEQKLCEEIITKSGAKAENLAGKLTLLESAVLVNKLDLLLTNDSAPLHMANAVNTPVIAILGPTVTRFGCYPYRPKDQIIEVELNCRPCGKHGGLICPNFHFRCMRDITPQKVYDKIDEFFKENRDN